MQSCGSSVKARAHGVSEGQDCRDRAGDREQGAGDRCAGDDGRGKNLIEWLRVTAEQFRNPDLFFLLPMDFYYPETGRGGDLPPRKGFREFTRWLQHLVDGCCCGEC